MFRCLLYFVSSPSFVIFMTSMPYLLVGTPLRSNVLVGPFFCTSHEVDAIIWTFTFLVDCIFTSCIAIFFLCHWPRLLLFSLFRCGRADFNNWRAAFSFKVERYLWVVVLPFLHLSFSPFGLRLAVTRACGVEQYRSFNFVSFLYSCFLLARFYISFGILLGGICSFKDHGYCVG